MDEGKPIGPLDERLKEEQPTRTPLDRRPFELVASDEGVTA
jgi:hypothetical protein